MAWAPWLFHWSIPSCNRTHVQCPMQRAEVMLLALLLYRWTSALKHSVPARPENLRWETEIALSNFSRGGRTLLMVRRGDCDRAPQIGSLTALKERRAIGYQ